MFRFNLKIISRHFLRNKIISIFGTLGLSLGFAVILYVALYVNYELSYDKNLKDSDKIYRLHVNFPQWARSLFILGEELNQKYPSVCEQTTFLFSEHNTIINPQTKFPMEENHIMCVDTNFINFFGFKILTGNAKNIGLPNTAIITPEIAKKYFGNKNPIGEELEVKSIQYCSEVGKFTIIGIVEQAPQNIHFTYNIILSQKGNLDARIKTLKERVLFGSYTYLKVIDKKYIPQLKEYINKILEENQANFQGPPLTSIVHELQPLKEIHLKSNLGHELKPVNSTKQLLILTIVGIIILLISLVNFIILHSTQIINRGKEIAFRKISGASNLSILKYLSLESFLYALTSVYLSIVIIELIRPIIKNHLQIDIPLAYTSLDTIFFVSLLIIVTIFIFDLFTVLLIRKVNLINIFKLGLTGKTGGEKIRKILTITQFAGAIGLLIFVFSVYKQLNFIETKELGFKSEDIIVINNQDQMLSDAPFIQKIKQLPSVNSVSCCKQYPTYPMNVTKMPLPNDEEIQVKLTIVDSGYIENMGINTIQQFEIGNLNEEAGVFINEKLFNILLLTFNSDVDKILTFPFGIRIKSVIQDFHYESLHQQIEPFFFFIGNKETRYKTILISVNPDDKNTTLNEIENVWKNYYPEQYFDFSYLNDDIRNQYKSEIQYLSVIKGTVIILLLIISMGLLGTTTLMMKSRQSEIAIKKILGASTFSLYKHYLMYFSIYVALAFLLATPVLYFLLKKWYLNFQYKVGIDIWEFILSGCLILFYVLIIITWKIQKSIKKNPLDSLRYE